MKYTNILSITLHSDVRLPIKITHNNQSVDINLHNQIAHTIILEPNIDHTIALEQLPNPHSKFFYVQKVELGKLNITKLLHYDNVCSVIDKISQIKFGEFVEDIGQNDQIIMNINQNFYSNIINRIAMVSTLDH